MSLFDEAPAPSSTPAAPSGPSVRVRLQVAYNGRDFHGFALQAAGVRTVASVLSATLAKVLQLPEPPVLTCAGRTDTGVHAWDQWVHVDVPASLDVTGLHRRLVKLLAPEIVVRGVDIAPAGWDARHSALSRTYRYDVLTTPVPSPLNAGFVWWLPGALDLRAMSLACDAIIGTHDFGSFCRKQGDATLVRRVMDAGWSSPAPGLLRFEITANAFCQQMVRSLVGTLVDIGGGKRRAGEMLSIIHAKDRAVVVGALAPPDGLILWEVRYPDE